MTFDSTNNSGEYSIYRQGGYIALTDAEALKVYLQKADEFLVEDALEQLEAYIESENTVGVCLSVTAEELPDSVIHEAVRQFNKRKDCNVAENDTWHSIWSDLLKTYVVRKHFQIFEEGYVVNGNSCGAHYIGRADGTDFLDACQNYMDRTGRGRFYKDKDGNRYPGDWGCRWFPTFEEARRSYG